MTHDKNLTEMLEESRREEDRLREEYFSKCGPYTGDECPNCGRIRVMKGKDKKRRCEKCCWCIEDKEYDNAFYRY